MVWERSVELSGRKKANCCKYLRFNDTEEEADNHEMCKVVRECCHSRDNAPSCHTSRQVETWSDSCQDEIGRDLQRKIAGKEHRDGRVELRSFHTKVLLDSLHTGVGKGIAVEVADCVSRFLLLSFFSESLTS